MASDYTPIVFNVRTEHVPRLLDGLATYYGYQDELDGQPNPESKAQYIRRKIRQEWVTRVQHAELQLVQADPIEIEES